MHTTIQFQSLGEAIKNAIHDRTAINILIGEAKTLFATFSRYEKMNCDPEKLQEYKITHLSAIERKFKDLHWIAETFGGDTLNNFCKWHLKVEKTLSKLLLCK